jgi:hypothetical protein
MPDPSLLVQMSALVRALWRGLPIVGDGGDRRRTAVGVAGERAFVEVQACVVRCSGGSPGSGRQGEGVGVAGTHGVEVTAIEGGDLRDAEGEVGVGLDEFGHAFVVSEFEVDDRDGLRDDGAEERRFDLGAAGAGQEVADLGDDRCGDQDGAASQV